MKKLLALACLICLLCCPSRPGRAQNLPPPGAYQPIPNYTGTGAGMLFRQAINDRFSGAQPISPVIAGLTFANLPAETDGSIFYCTNCQKTSVCAAGGSGAWALGQNGQWTCAAGGAVTSAYVGPLSLSGNQANGSDQISHVNLNGVINPQDYGALCTNETVSCTATASSANLTCGGIGSTQFAVGQHIKIDHAGANNALSAPTLGTSKVYSYYFNPRPIPTLHTSGGDYQGCQTDSTASLYQNSGCSASRTYEVQDVAFNGSWSAPSSAATVTGSATKLSPDNYIRVPWTNDPNAVGQVICGCTGASCTPNQIWAVLPVLPVGETAAHSQYWDDQGNHFGRDADFGTTCPGVAKPADLLTTITAINPTTGVVTVAIAPSQSGTVTMRHDNEPSLAAALLAAQPVSGAGANQAARIDLPYCSVCYPLGQPLSFYGTGRETLVGSSNAQFGSAGTCFEWDGPTAGIVFNLNNAGSMDLENLAFPGGAVDPGSTPGLAISFDNYSGTGPGGNPAGRSSGYTGAGHFRNISIGYSGIGFTIDSNGSIGNVENSSWDNVDCVSGGWACFYGASAQTNRERITGGNINATWDYGFAGIFGGVAVKDFDDGAMTGIAVQGASSGTFTFDGGDLNGAYGFLNLGSVMRLSAVKAEPQVGPTGYFGYVGGPTEIRDSSWSTGNIAINSSSGASGCWLGSAFNVMPPLANSNSGGSYPAIRGSLPFTDLSGGQHSPSFASIFDSVNVSGTGITPIGIVFGNESGKNEALTLINAFLTSVPDASASASNPAVSSCGTTPSISGNNGAMVITIGSGTVTSCALAFASHPAFTNAPICTCVDVTAGLALKQSSLSTSGVTLATTASSMGGDTVNCTCTGQ
ncbi:MAG TPA: hypothetical protein VEC38_15170 [Candidatus Binataceae bacterium]|nr:hypothetical protein [Candidatus Binataceae bacterium]